MKENKNEKINSFFAFPEKLSSLLLVLFVAVMAMIDTLVIVFLVPKVDSSTLGVLDLAKDMRLFSVLSCANYLAQDRAERNAI